MSTPLGHIRLKKRRRQRFSLSWTDLLRDSGNGEQLDGGAECTIAAGRPDTALDQQLEVTSELPNALLCAHAETDRTSCSNGTKTSLPADIKHSVGEVLAKLSMTSISSTADAIVAIINQLQCCDEPDERLFAQIARLIYEGALNNPSSSETYARLCRGIIWGSRSTACVEGTRNSVDLPESLSGQLFHHHLVARCQKDFERGHAAAKESALSTATEPPEAPKTVGDTASARARLRRVACVKFIGELFNQQLLTPSIMDECLRKLPVENDEEIECSCMLLATAGRKLASDGGAPSIMKAVLYLMSLSATRLGVSPYAQGMMSDVITLSDNGWDMRTMELLHIGSLYRLLGVDIDVQRLDTASSLLPSPRLRSLNTLQDAHPAAPSHVLSAGVASGGGKESGCDTAAGNMKSDSNSGPALSSDRSTSPTAISQGKLQNQTSVTLVVEDGDKSDVHSPEGEVVMSKKKMKKMARKKKQRERLLQSRLEDGCQLTTKADTDITEEGEVEKMMAAAMSLLKLTSDDEDLQRGQAESSPSISPDVSAPFEMSADSSSDTQVPPQSEEDSTEKPASQPIVSPSVPTKEDNGVSEHLMSREQLQRLKDAVADFLKIRDLGMGEQALRSLSAEHQWRFINKAVLAALLCEGLSTAQLVGELVSSATSKGLCSPDSLVRGFSRVVEVLDVVAVHTPDASSRVAIMLRGMRLERARLVSLVEQAVGYEHEMLVGLLL